MPRSTSAGPKKTSASPARPAKATGSAKATKSAKSAKAATSKPSSSKTSKAAAAKPGATKAKAAKAAKATTTKAGTASAPSKAGAAEVATAKTTGKAAKGRSSTPEKAPARKKAPFPARWLSAQQKALETERASYTRQAESLRAEADALVADFEPGDVQFDEESGEGDTLNIERERDLALSAQARQAVDEIDHALAKFDLGTYGICEISGEPIPVERLEAIPWARERVEYKTGGLGRR